MFSNENPKTILKLQQETATAPLPTGWERSGNMGELLSSNATDGTTVTYTKKASTETPASIPDPTPRTETDVKQAADTSKKPCITRIFFTSETVVTDPSLEPNLQPSAGKKRLNLQVVCENVDEKWEQDIQPFQGVSSWFGSGFGPSTKPCLSLLLKQTRQTVSNAFFDFLIQKELLTKEEAVYFKLIFGYKTISSQAARDLLETMEKKVKEEAYEEAVQIAKEIHTIENEEDMDVALLLGKRLIAISSLDEHKHDSFKILLHAYSSFDILHGYYYCRQAQKYKEEIAIDLTERLINTQQNGEQDRAHQVKVLGLLMSLGSNKKLWKQISCLFEKYAGLNPLDPDPQNRLFEITFDTDSIENNVVNTYTKLFLGMAEKLYEQGNLLSNPADTSLKENNNTVTSHPVETKQKEEAVVIASTTEVSKRPTAEGTPLLPAGWKKIENTETIDSAKGEKNTYQVQRQQASTLSTPNNAEGSVREPENKETFELLRVGVERIPRQYRNRSGEMINKPLVCFRLFFKPVPVKDFREKSQAINSNIYYVVTDGSGGGVSSMRFLVGRAHYTTILFQDLIEIGILLKEESEYLHAICGDKAISEKELSFLKDMESALKEKNYDKAIEFARKIHLEDSEDFVEVRKLLQGDYPVVQDVAAAFSLGERLMQESPRSAIKAFEILPSDSFYYKKAHEHISRLAFELYAGLSDEKEKRPFRTIMISSLLNSTMTFDDYRNARFFIEVHAGFNPAGSQNRLFNSLSDKEEERRGGDFLLLDFICMADKIFQRNEEIAQKQPEVFISPSTATTTPIVSAGSSAQSNLLTPLTFSSRPTGTNPKPVQGLDGDSDDDIESRYGRVQKKL